jgi:hypothetical protein
LWPLFTNKITCLWYEYHLKAQQKHHQLSDTIKFLAQTLGTIFPISFATGHTVVSWSLQARRLRVGDPMRQMTFFHYIILPAALGPGVPSASNRNGHQKQKNNVFGE